MATYNNADLPDAFLSGEHWDGKNRTGSFWFQGEKIYSYATCIGVVDRQRKLLFFNEEKYSITTTSHQTDLRAAAYRQGFDVLGIPAEFKTLVGMSKARRRKYCVQHMRSFAEMYVANRSTIERHWDHLPWWLKDLVSLVRQWRDPVTTSQIRGQVKHVLEVWRDVATNRAYKETVDNIAILTDLLGYQRKVLDEAFRRVELLHKAPGHKVREVADNLLRWYGQAAKGGGEFVAGEPALFALTNLRRTLNWAVGHLDNASRVVGGARRVVNSLDKKRMLPYTKRAHRVFDAVLLRIRRARRKLHALMAEVEQEQQRQNEFTQQVMRALLPFEGHLAKLFSKGVGYKLLHELPPKERSEWLKYFETIDPEKMKRSLALARRDMLRGEAAHIAVLAFYDRVKNVLWTEFFEKMRGNDKQKLLRALLEDTQEWLQEHLSQELRSALPAIFQKDHPSLRYMGFVLRRIHDYVELVYREYLRHYHPDSAQAYVRMVARARELGYTI